MVDKQKILSEFMRYFIGYEKSVENIDSKGRINSQFGITMINQSPLDQLPVSFGEVKFFMAIDKELRSLKGAPEVVIDTFDIDSNPLGSNGLRYGPHTVGGYYWCNNCKLTTLAGAPRKVKGFFCSDNQLQTLLGAPDEVVDDFFCINNPLKSLEGLPKHIPGELRLTYDENLPLLRALVASMVTFDNYYEDLAEDVQQILKKYAGEGKRGAIRCQKELIAAGFEGNAKW